MLLKISKITTFVRLNTLLMKYSKGILFIFFLFTAYQVLGQSRSPVFKAIHVAEYNAQREPNLPREKALSEWISEKKRYDESGNLKEQIKYQSTDMVYETKKISWSEDSLMQTTITFDGDKNIKGVWTAKWNEEGILLEATNKNEKGEVTVKQSNEYDTVGNLVLRKMENVGSDKIGTTSFVYDAAGNVKEEIKYNPYRDRIVKRTFQYDQAGNEIVQEIFKGSGNYTKLVSENDIHGNLVEQCWYDKAGELKSQTSFSYIYDEYNNWTTKIRLTNQVLSYIWEREIIYWP